MSHLTCIAFGGARFAKTFFSELEPKLKPPYFEDAGMGSGTVQKSRFRIPASDNKL